MKQFQDRCDACGKFVVECSLLVDDRDEENHRSICSTCSEELAASERRILAIVSRMVDYCNRNRRNMQYEKLLDFVCEIDAEIERQP